MASSQTISVENMPSQANEKSGVLRKKIWIDLDNSPHIPFFAPIIPKLEALGYSVVMTGRDAYQVSELVELFDLDCKIIGRHYGKNKLLKVWGVMLRALRLIPFIVREKPDLAVAHGSRTQLLASFLLGITVLQIGDYEHSSRGYSSRPEARSAIPGNQRGRVCSWFQARSGDQGPTRAPRIGPGCDHP